MAESSSVSSVAIPSNQMQKKNAFKIDDVVIKTLSGEKYPSWLSIELHEDIFSNTLSGSILVKDGVNILRHGKDCFRKWSNAIL